MTTESQPDGTTAEKTIWWIVLGVITLSIVLMLSL
ncbi:hypothetical protein M2317_003249 [Microbacterium sp. ZKA21]|jgi:hypothetical protein